MFTKIGTVTEIEIPSRLAKIAFPNNDGESCEQRYEVLLPVNAMKRLIAWLPVGSMVQINRRIQPNSVDRTDELVRNSFYINLTSVYIKSSFVS